MSECADRTLGQFDLRTRIIAALWRFACPDQLHDDNPEPPEVFIRMADAVIRELNPAKACEGGCVWQIPRRVEDMTQQQRELLGKPPLFGQHLAVGDDGPIMLNITSKEDDA